MKLKCRCGHELDVWPGGPATMHRCMYCGCGIQVLDGDSTHVRIRITPRASPTSQRAGMRYSRPGAGRAGERAADAGSAARPWRHWLAEAWAYPLRGWLPWCILAWAAVTSAIAFLPLYGPYQAAARLVFVFLLGCILLLYGLEIISQSAWDAESPAAPPDWDDVVEESLRAFVLLLAAAAISAVPLGLAAWPLLWSGCPAWWRAVLVPAGAISLLMLPMHVLAAATADGFGALHPRHTVPPVARIFGPYLIFCALAAAVGTACYLLGRRLVQPGSPTLLGTVAVLALTVYALTVLARALGTLHYVYRDRIGWVR